MGFKEALSDELQRELEEIELIEDSDEWLKRWLDWFRRSIDSIEGK
jgi:hypothetical protein